MKKLLVIGILCVLCVSVVNPEDIAKPSDKQQVTSDKIKELIKQLGSDDFETREKAQKELTEYGTKLIEQYRTAKRDKNQETSNNIKKEIEKFAQSLKEGTKSNDPEIKMRANKTRQHFYTSLQPKIAFQSSRDGENEYQYQIYVMDADGKNQKRLTENKADNEGPAWSPDGTKIAFASTQDGKVAIYVMDADGRSQTRLTENKAFNSSPAWSSDGKKIAFASYWDGNWQIYVMDSDGKNQTRLTEDNGRNDSPAWSPIFLPELIGFFAPEK